MFAERDFLLGANVEVVDFSMCGDATRPSGYARPFSSQQSYKAGGVTRARFPSDSACVMPHGVNTERLRPTGRDDGYLRQ